MTTPSTPDPAGPDLSAGETSYADAQAELDAILRELDGDEVDVDVLGARVRRAAELLRLCRDRIAAARFEVEQVVGELEAEVDAAVADDFDEAEDHEDDEDLDDEDDGLDERDEAEHDDDAELAGWSAGDEP
jgi:exodeoxyribonuclease VII small subunit